MDRYWKLKKMQIQLSADESREYKKLEDDLKGFQDGIQAAFDFVRRQKIQEILKARQPQQTAQSGVQSHQGADNDANPSPVAAQSTAESSTL